MTTTVEDKRKSFARRAESLVERVRIMRTIYEVSQKQNHQNVCSNINHAYVSLIWSIEPQLSWKYSWGYFFGYFLLCARLTRISIVHSIL